MIFLNLLLVNLERSPVPPLSQLRVSEQRVPTLSEWRLRPTNCISTGWMSLFNLPLLTLERHPVPALSEIEYHHYLSEQYDLTICIRAVWMSFFNLHEWL